MVSDSCIVQSETIVVATFNKGVPTTSSETTPELRFISSNGSNHYAIFDAAAVLSNPLSIALTTSGTSSSFAGGQTLQITASGLTSDVMLGKAVIRVCEKPCEIIEAFSTS